MSSLTGVSNTVAASSIAGYGLFNQLQRSLPGDQSRVVFLRNNIAEVQFDCCLSESHAYQATPTAFPIESGAFIADHIQTAPIQLQLQGVVADHPPEEAQSLITSGVSAVGSYAFQDFGALGTLGSTVGFTSLASAAMGRADGKAGAALSRSAAVYATLRRLAGYSQVDDGSAQKQSMPADVVDVVTAKLGKRFCRFGSMAITSLEMQRDNSVGSRALVFSISMQEVRRVTRSSSVVSFAMPVKQAPKKAVTAKTSESSGFEKEKAELEDETRSSFLGPALKAFEKSTPNINVGGAP